MSWTILILCPIELALYLGGGTISLSRMILEILVVNAYTLSAESTLYSGGGTISLSRIILEILVVNGSFCRLRMSWTILTLCPIELALYLGGGTISLS